MFTLIVFWIGLIASIAHKSITADEGVHLTGGYTYWKYNDYRVNPENGNLPQRIFALPVVGGAYTVTSRESAIWQANDQLALTDEWLNRLGNDHEKIVLRGRMAAGLIAVALGALIWLWSRQLFGPLGALLALLLYVLNPTVLANGALMTSDIASALFFLGSTWMIWNTLHRVTITRVLISALFTGGLFVSKMSAIVILPIASVLIAARLIRKTPLPGQWFSRRYEIVRPWQLALVFAVIIVIHATIVYGVIWGVYGFRYSMVANAQPNTFLHWDTLLEKATPLQAMQSVALNEEQARKAMDVLRSHDASPDEWTAASHTAIGIIKQTILTKAQGQKLDTLLTPKATTRIFQFLIDHKIFPEAYIFGHAHVLHHASARGAFFNGDYSMTGWRAFFPYTVAVKTPPALFGIILLSAGALFLQRRSQASAASRNPPSKSVTAYDLLPLFTLMILYWATIILGHLNIGHRHTLPTYPPVFIFCGAMAFLINFQPRSWMLRTAAIPSAALLLGHAVMTLCQFPNYIAYFNSFVGGPAQGYKHLIDSSLDWGQELPATKDYLTKTKSARTYLAYFGCGSPRGYGIHFPTIDCSPSSSYDEIIYPIFRVVESLSSSAEQTVAEVIAETPGYEVMGHLESNDPNHIAIIFLKRPEAWQLSGGTYLISATLFYSVALPNGPFGPWNTPAEETYQKVQKLVSPLLKNDVAARRQALSKAGVDEWRHIISTYIDYRFARLAAWLRKHHLPEEQINYSVLVFHLTDQEVREALDGPPPELGRDVVMEYRLKSIGEK